MPAPLLSREFARIAERAHALAAPSNPADPSRRNKVEEVALLLEAHSDLMGMLAQQVESLTATWLSCVPGPDQPGIVPPAPLHAADGA